MVPAGHVLGQSVETGVFGADDEVESEYFLALQGLQTGSESASPATATYVPAAHVDAAGAQLPDAPFWFVMVVKLTLWKTLTV